MKIYVVTQGYYNNYRIITATTDEEIANKIARKFSCYGDIARVEVYEDAEFYMKTVFYVRFDKQGKVTEIYNKSKEAVFYKAINECDFDCTVDGRQVYVIVQADNEGDAIKIAREKRTKFLAEKVGIAE